MSELIRKYKPPKLSKGDLEAGVRYVQEIPAQEDKLGNSIDVGDLVIYATGYGSTPKMHVAKIIGKFAKVIPAREYRGNKIEPILVSGITIVVSSHNYLRRVTTQGVNLIKYSEDLCSQEVKGILIPA